MLTFKVFVPLAAAGLLLGACGHTLEQRAATGAVGGAAAGALLDGTRGAILGGAAGAAGGAILHESQRR